MGIFHLALVLIFSVLAVLLILFGFGWKAFIAAAFIIALCFAIYCYLEQQISQEGHSKVFHHLRAVILPELLEQLKFSYKACSQSVNQTTQLYEDLNQHVERAQATLQQDTIDVEQLQQDIDSLNSTCERMLALHQVSEKNLQCQLGVMESMTMLLERIQKVEQGEGYWSEEEVLEQLREIEMRTQAIQQHLGEKARNEQKID
ncbi:hypothetical protein J4N42_05570 [Vibrio sp. SCSIO 43135]|uniref:hypothetical protein n=1 Tax=Vibrio sp. SCSIO 43135 TaxID=2819096 RepID=UPI0020762D5E|nr:hypothetical protein [Vibrio sp. SCSIO 43135]USD42190.1 hypothetical protein J4N42_05570 [Vibrio sp. SCSIO 43135]